MSQKKLVITPWRATNQNNPANVPQDQPEGDELVVIASSGNGKDTKIILANNRHQTKNAGNVQHNDYEGICIRVVPVGHTANPGSNDYEFSVNSACSCETRMIFNEEYKINPATNEFCNHY